MSLGEDIFKKEIEKRKQIKIEEMVLNFLREKRKTDGTVYTVARIA